MIEYSSTLLCIVWRIIQWLILQGGCWIVARRMGICRKAQKIHHWLSKPQRITWKQECRWRKIIKCKQVLGNVYVAKKEYSVTNTCSRQVWTSTQKKSRQTASVFSEENVAVRQYSMLNQLNPGEVDGLTLDEIKVLMHFFIQDDNDLIYSLLH